MAGLTKKRTGRPGDYPKRRETAPGKNAVDKQPRHRAGTCFSPAVNFGRKAEIIRKWTQSVVSVARNIGVKVGSGVIIGSGLA